MPVRVTRKRGPYWYAAGTIRVGTQGSRFIAEHSTGHGDRDDAERYAARLTAQTELEIVHGAAGRARCITIDKLLCLYLAREGGLHRNDAWRVAELAKVIGEEARLPELLDCWARFRRIRCQGMKPATVDRFRAILQAGVTYGCDQLGIQAPPKLPTIRFNNQKVRFLTELEQERLLAAYNRHVAPVALALAYQGCRTQEALQLRWRHVDLQRGTLYFDRTKNGEPRTVTMHERVANSIRAIWMARNGPDADDHVFLSHRGRPYADTRDSKMQGGNPISKAHATACRIAGIRDFRPHDWRHHWAARMTMAGVDQETIRRLGGWKSLRMLERYSAVSTEHQAAAMRKLA